jgi:hypothetical protein
MVLELVRLFPILRVGSAGIKTVQLLSAFVALDVFLSYRPDRLERCHAFCSNPHEATRVSSSTACVNPALVPSMNLPMIKPM